NPASSEPQLMHEITLVLQSVQQGDPRASEALLEMVYDQLRALARSRMKREPGGGAGMTLDATALVHEAYLRVVGDKADAPPQVWENRGHFFGAAALAMRRILVERARHRKRIKHGGGREREALDSDHLLAAQPEHDGTDLIALDEALNQLEQLDPRKAK